MTKLPSFDEIEAWITANPDRSSRRDIARAFGLKSAEKAELAAHLRAFGEAKKQDMAAFVTARIVAIGDDGDLVAERLDSGKPLVFSTTKPVGLGDEVELKISDGKIRFLRKVENDAPQFLARVEARRDGNVLVTLNRGRADEYALSPNDALAKPGRVVLAEAAAGGRIGRRALPRAKIIEVIGEENNPHILSEIALREYRLASAFAPETLREAEQVVPLDVPREDLTEMGFLTIDPIDARDHDDAVAIEATETGWRLFVAIADVAAFVRMGSALDLEARARGNSTYFPDRVIPMLPDHLSADLCSLHEGVVRPVLYVVMEINQDGRKTSHKFGRANIAVRASLSYEEAQSIADDPETAPADIRAQIAPLFACYHPLKTASIKRGALALDLPEQEIKLDQDGKVLAIQARERLDAHQLIEEAMILANVAAAETLEEAHANFLYRIHEPPKPEKAEVLGKIAKATGYKMAQKNAVSVQALNALLDHVAGSARAEAISMQVLRTMQQARYSPSNAGHFGLALKGYAHFTSPIRRYADLLVHRALISALSFGDDGDQMDAQTLGEIADHISGQERLSMQAERDTIARYTARFLEPKIGEEMGGRINGLNKFGLFISLEGTHADGFVPLGRLDDDHYRFDRLRDLIRGNRTGRVFTLGQEVRVKIMATNALTGGIELDLTEHEGKAFASGGFKRRAKSHKGRNKSARARKKR